MDVVTAALRRFWSHFGRIVTVLLVANLALGMALSVVGLFSEVNRVDNGLVIMARYWANIEQRDALEWEAIASTSLPPGFVGSMSQAQSSSQYLVGQLENTRSLFNSTLVRDNALYASQTRQVERDIIMGSRKSAQLLLWGGTNQTIAQLYTELTSTRAAIQAKIHRTSIVADIEVLSMMVFAALMAALLFRKFRLARLSSDLVAMEERSRAQSRFRSLVNHSSDVLVVLDEEMNVVFLTPSWERTFDTKVSDVVGKPLLEMVAPEDRLLLLADMQSSKRIPGPQVVSRWMNSDGSTRYMESVCTNLVDNPDVRAIVVNARDITERRELEEQLIHNAFHDSLTGLANRVLFEERLGSALRRSRAGAAISVLFIDLDDFKGVNDAFGHAVGDELLRAVAQRLRVSASFSDTMARLAGDEFALLFTGEEAVKAKAMAEILVTALGHPYRLSVGEVAVGASIGVANASQEDSEAEGILRNADVAMYVAKKEGKRGVALFDSEMHHEILERLQLRIDLAFAVERQEIVVVYQPVVNLGNSEIVGVEALVRWHHPKRGVISPLEFIPIAEESGSIVGIGREVLRQACVQMASWNRERGDFPLSLNVNVSVRELGEEDLVESVSRCLQDSGLGQGVLTLELTETVLLSRPEEFVPQLSRLRALGVRIAIDDFGTGYSSLSYLTVLPLDSLKIDKSFVDRLLLGEPPVTLRSIVQLGRDLDLKMVAEGIEEASQADSLVELGCSYGQGFHFAKPLSSAELTQMMASGPEGTESSDDASPWLLSDLPTKSEDGELSAVLIDGEKI